MFQTETNDTGLGCRLRLMKRVHLTCSVQHGMRGQASADAMSYVIRKPIVSDQWYGLNKIIFPYMARYKKLCSCSLYNLVHRSVTIHNRYNTLQQLLGCTLILCVV